MRFTTIVALSAIFASAVKPWHINISSADPNDDRVDELNDTGADDGLPKTQEVNEARLPRYCESNLHACHSLQNQVVSCVDQRHNCNSTDSKNVIGTLLQINMCVSVNSTVASAICTQWYSEALCCYSKVKRKCGHHHMLYLLCKLRKFLNLPKNQSAYMERQGGTEVLRFANVQPKRVALSGMSVSGRDDNSGDKKNRPRWYSTFANAEAVEQRDLSYEPHTTETVEAPVCFSKVEVYDKEPVETSPCEFPYCRYGHDAESKPQPKWVTWHAIEGTFDVVQGPVTKEGLVEMVSKRKKYEMGAKEKGEGKPRRSHVEDDGSDWWLSDEEAEEAEEEGQE